MSSSRGGEQGRGGRLAARAGVKLGLPPPAMRCAGLLTMTASLLRRLRTTCALVSFVVPWSATAIAQPPPPAWTRGATCYEVFVRSFYDSDGDGIGDLKGLPEKLDYINDGNPNSRRDLGARCVWLMPVA